MLQESERLVCAASTVAHWKAHFTQENIDKLQNDLLRIAAQKGSPVELDELRQSTRATITKLQAIRTVASGDSLAGAELIEVLASGEFGTVWKAKRSDGRLCAVKIFHPHRLEHGGALREFRLGVRAMKTLADANAPRSIVRLLDSDCAGLAFSMSLVDGKDLRNLSSRAWTLQKKMEVFTNLCRAVGFAHEHSVLHRDLKPDNILIDDSTGEPVLTDFDLADMLTLQTLTLHSAGTLAFAAPEQLEPPKGGSPPRLKESDIYSLGRVLQFLLTEKIPSGVYRTAVPALPELEQFPGLVRIVRRCTLGDPAQRYKSVEDLLAEVERCERLPQEVGVGLEPRNPPTHTLHEMERKGSPKGSRRAALGTAIVVPFLGALAMALATYFGNSRLAESHVESARISVGVNGELSGSSGSIPKGAHQEPAPHAVQHDSSLPSSGPATATTVAAAKPCGPIPLWQKGGAQIRLFTTKTEHQAIMRREHLIKDVLHHTEGQNWSKHITRPIRSYPTDPKERHGPVYLVSLNQVQSNLETAVCQWLACVGVPPGEETCGVRAIDSSLGLPSTPQ